MKLDLKFDNVSIGFEKTEIVSNINLSLESSRFIYLIGKNGVGKSCLLKSMAGIISAISGKILLSGKDLNQYSQLERAQNISILLTEKMNVEFITVYEMVSYGRSPYTNWSGALSDNDKKIIDQVLNDLKIYELKDEQFHNLSDGQKQKVLLARALVQTPKLLLLDEPTNFLDIPSKIEFLKTLKKICKDNEMIVIMSTHDLILMEELADDVLLLNKKKMVKYTPEELMLSGVLKDVFNLNLN